MACGFHSSVMITITNRYILLTCFLTLSQVKRVPGASGRMRKNDEGEWEWSDDGECPEDARPKAAAAVSLVLNKPQSILINHHS